MRRAHLLAPLLIAGSLALAGCGQEALYSGLTEREANEMLAVVESAGIGASKASKDGET
jgi:type III secretion protein J